MRRKALPTWFCKKSKKLHNVYLQESYHLDPQPPPTRLVVSHFGLFVHVTHFFSHSLSLSPSLFLTLSKYLSFSLSPNISPSLSFSLSLYLSLSASLFLSSNAFGNRPKSYTCNETKKKVISNDCVSTREQSERW